MRAQCIVVTVIRMMKWTNDSLLWQEIRQFAPALWSLAFFSFVLAMMYVVPSIYMHQLFERVFQSRSFETLASLSAIVLFLCMIWTAVEIIRVRTLQRISIALNERISGRVFEALNRQTDRLPAAARNIVMQDVQTIREFLAGNMVLQALDLMWVPFILAVAFLYHPLLGVTLTVLTVIVVLMATVTQNVAREDIQRGFAAAARASEFGRAVINAAEPVRVMGMLPSLASMWKDRQKAALGWQSGAVRRTEVLNASIKFLRHVYSPIMLTVGSVLYLNEMVGAGVIFAASVLTNRVIMPVDVIASNWKAFWNFRLSAARIDTMLKEAEKKTEKVRLPQPNGALVLSRVFATPRDRDMVVLSDISFAVEPGQVVGVVGPSGAGKSSLSRVLVGAWPVQKGLVTLDGANLSHWDQDHLGRHIGYVPQDVDLLPGTVADNIARFDPPGDERDTALLEATNVANIQDIIRRLPDGLNTKLGPDGYTLSGGQRQRIALARAVYGRPRLIVLDEPNSNLDAAGEESLGQAINKMRELDSIVMIVTHRMNMLSYCDRIIVLNAGTVHAFGERDHILDRLGDRTAAKQVALRSSTMAA
jgi:PrtD family type I secretion system ABC transporter